MTTKKLHRGEQSSYTSFLRSIEPFFISLTDSSFHGDREQYFEHQKHELDVDWKTEVTKQWEESFDVRANVKIRMFAPASKRDFFTLTASYLLHVHAPAPLDPQYVKKFTESEVRLIIWPYVREYATSVFGRMHVPPAILPVTGSKGARKG
jgi:preprotein translocase subunit SecB